MKKYFLIALAGLITLTSAADIEAGKARSIVCGGCHGQNGIGTTPIYPNLAGQKAQYLVLQMKAYKDGSRKSATMVPMTAPLSDEDIANLAAYYESLPADGK